MEVNRFKTAEMSLSPEDTSLVDKFYEASSFYLFPCWQVSFYSICVCVTAYLYWVYSLK